MMPCSLKDVSLWLDDEAQDEATFQQAMDWAFRLHLPLRVAITSARFARQTPKHDREPVRVLDTIKAWGAACAASDVALESSFLLGGTSTGMENFLRSRSLCAIGTSRFDQHRDELMFRSARMPGAILLLCPPLAALACRVAVVYQHMNPAAAYLETVAQLCQAATLRPLILTLARTERDARLKQCHAEGVCAALGLSAEFALIVSSDARTDIARTVSWQDCTHLIVQRDNDAAWPHMHGDWYAAWQGLGDSLSILALPESTGLDVPWVLRHPEVAGREKRLHHAESKHA